MFFYVPGCSFGVIPNNHCNYTKITPKPIELHHHTESLYAGVILGVLLGCNFIYVTVEHSDEQQS